MKQDRRRRERALYDVFSHKGAQTALYETAGHAQEIRLSRAYLGDERYVREHVRAGVINLVDKTQRVFGEMLRAWGAQPEVGLELGLRQERDHLKSLEEIVREASQALELAGLDLDDMPTRDGEAREAVVRACRALRAEIKRVERAASEELGVASAFSRGDL